MSSQPVLTTEERKALLSNCLDHDEVCLLLGGFLHAELRSLAERGIPVTLERLINVLMVYRTHVREKLGVAEGLYAARHGAL